MVKSKLIVKPTQSGKTWELLQRTTKIIEDNYKAVHIILTDNSLIQLDQLFDRVISTTGEGTIVLNSACNIPIEKIKNYLCEYKIKYILLCANMTQINKVNNLMKTMLKIKIPKCKNRAFYIWIDEGDKISEPGNIKIIDDWSTYKNVHGLAFITATPHSLIVRYNKMYILKVQQIYNKNTYNKWSDCKVITFPEIDNSELFIKQAFKKKEPKKGDIWFIAPGNLTDTHDETAKFLNKKNFYVLTINATGEILTSPNGEVKKMEGNASLADRINFLYTSNNLNEQKFAIVGYNRLGRGITIQSNECFITHAVFPTTPKNKASIYQLAGRLCGNYKQYKKFKPPYVFCSKYFDKVAFESEDIVIDIAKLSMVDVDIYDKLEEKANKKYIKSI